MTRTSLSLAGAICALAVAAASSPALAHAVCGNRVFPATLTMDDPGVGDEFSFPTLQYVPNTASAGGGQSFSTGFEWDKTITEHFGFSINDDYVSNYTGGSHQDGWDNVTVGLKDEVYCNDDHEFMASIGVSRTFAKTGTSSLLQAGAIDTVSSTSPTVYFGKGLGDLPIGWLRAFAVTGELAYQASDSPHASASAWNYSASVQYSIPYLQQHIKDLQLPEVVANLTPIVEVNFSTATNGPGQGQTTGTIAPGLLYDADTWQMGVEAILPANRLTSDQQGVGVIAQFHLFLDDIFPTTIGKPIF